MDSEVYKTTIDILRYVLCGEKIEIAPNTDFEDLYLFSKNHGVENMIYVGLRDLNIAVPQKIMEQFKQAYEMQIMVEAVQALELESIGGAFEEAGIDYLPLKGSVIKYLYPMPDYRKSGDIDILIKPETLEIATDILISLGYIEKMEAHDHPVHRVFTKAPYMTIELHRKLTRSTERAGGFCDCVWDYVYIDKASHCYNMTNEYLYVYCLAHFCKHLYYGGIGISHLNDLFILKNELNFDETVMKNLLLLAELSEINDVVNDLVEMWYGDIVTVNTDTVLLGNIVLTSGSFGSAEFRYVLTNSQKNGGKILRLLKKIFPPKNILHEKYPVLTEKYPTAVIWIYHWYFTVRYRRRAFNAFFKEISNNKMRDKRLINLIDMINEK